MGEFKKQWSYNDIYDFNVEFNRIESYNQYVENWLVNYYGYDLGNYVFVHKTNWTINDIVDMNDYNRVKRNINKLIELIDLSINSLSISNQFNQVWNVSKANEIENYLREISIFLGENQFRYNITNLTTCGNNLKLNGGI